MVGKRERGKRWERERVFKPEWLACFAHTRCFCDSSSFFRTSQASTSPASNTHTSEFIALTCMKTSSVNDLPPSSSPPPSSPSLLPPHLPLPPPSSSPPPSSPSLLISPSLLPLLPNSFRSTVADPLLLVAVSMGTGSARSLSSRFEYLTFPDTTHSIRSSTCVCVCVWGGGKYRANRKTGEDREEEGKGGE